ncbi:MAG: putative holin-like toxin [Lachnospira sp.]
MRITLLLKRLWGRILTLLVTFGSLIVTFLAFLIRVRNHKK